MANDSFKNYKEHNAWLIQEINKLLAKKKKKENRRIIIKEEGNAWLYFGTGSRYRLTGKTNNAQLCSFLCGFIQGLKI